MNKKRYTVRVIEVSRDNDKEWKTIHERDFDNLIIAGIYMKGIGFYYDFKNNDKVFYEEYILDNLH